MFYRLVFLLIFITPHCISAQEKSSWNIEFHGGIPINLPLPLTIKQNNQPDIKLIAQFYSEPFAPPVYWVFRISKWKNNKAWEFEMMHQKLYLKNATSEVQYFSITHGYNQLMMNRAFKFNLFKDKEFIFRSGAGIVLAHPENMVRGEELNQEQSFFKLGYYVAGPTINLALAKQIPLFYRFYLNTEIKNNTSFAKVPIADGNALVWHSAFELIAGLGFNITKKP